VKFQNSSWRFKSPGSVPAGVVSDFFELIKTIAEQGPFQDILESFKSRFATGTTSWSSNASWAESDLDRYMHDAAANAPRFIASFVDGCATWAAKGKDVPEVDVVNEILANHKAGYQVDGDSVIATDPNLSTVQIPMTPKVVVPAPVSFPLQAFICHSSGDKDPVRDLHQKLTSDGVIPWLDEENLLGRRNQESCAQ
jgi:hypothetical protein